jgi:hypothetical protein
MPNLAEGLLARLTDPTRAAAIMGDLTEMAVARGRLWFFAAYLRILATLVWRAPAAFLCGCLSLSFAIFLIGHRARYIPHQEGTLTIVPQYLASLIPFAGVFLVGMAIPLWFLVPFGLVRYGARDRLVRLAALFALLSTAALFSLAVLSLTNAVAALLLIVSTLFSPRWRKPMVVIAASATTGLAALVLFYDTLGKLYHPHILNPYESHPVAWMVAKMAAVVAMVVPAIVCSWMHDRILPPHSTGAQDA